MENLAEIFDGQPLSISPSLKVLSPEETAFVVSHSKVRKKEERDMYYLICNYDGRLRVWKSSELALVQDGMRRELVRVMEKRGFTDEELSPVVSFHFGENNFLEEKTYSLDDISAKYDCLEKDNWRIVSFDHIRDVRSMTLGGPSAYDEMEEYFHKPIDQITEEDLTSVDID